MPSSETDDLNLQGFNDDLNDSDFKDRQDEHDSALDDSIRHNKIYNSNDADGLPYSVSMHLKDEQQDL